ncbi:MAG: fibronectin type III-like domain-contianing protein, partial [Tannerellaceae bacterium]
ADRNIPAILETWFPSYLGGQVIAETLFGENNPGGKLTVTFPKSVGQIELNFPYKKGSHGGQYGSGPNGSGSTRVLGSLYPFGHGLSYTTFSYANLHIEAPAKGTQGTVNVSFDVTNTGKRTGDEVAQLYIQDKVSSVVTYDSQLRNFERITLAPGETKTVRFTLEPSDLQLLDKDMHWTVEPGTFEVRIGSSSEDIRLKDDFELLN